VGIADRRERAGRGAGVASPRRFIIREKTHERPKKIGEANRQTGCENGIHDQLSTIQHLRKLADWTRVKVLFDPCSTSQVVQEVEPIRRRSSFTMLAAAKEKAKTASATAVEAIDIAGKIVADAIGENNAVAIGVGGHVISRYAAPYVGEMSRVPRDDPPPDWNAPTTCWCGVPVMQRGLCSCLAKTALLPLTVPAYVLGVLSWFAADAWIGSSHYCWGCCEAHVCCTDRKDETKAETWRNAMRCTQFGSKGVRKIIKARRAFDDPVSCSEANNLNVHAFLALNGKCWCQTCPTHAHQVHGQCVEAPCQVWLLDSDPLAVPETAGGMFCEFYEGLGFCEWC